MKVGAPTKNRRKSRPSPPATPLTTRWLKEGGALPWVSSPWAAIVLACTAQFMVILDVSVVNVALPSIHHALGFSESGLQWVVNAYTITFAGFLLLGGRAADLLGNRRVFIGGLILFSLASLVGGFSQSQIMLVVARAAQGLGAAVISPSSLAIITTTFGEGHNRNRALGAWAAMGGAGGTFGVLVGGLLTDLISWQWILFINVPIGLAAATLSALYVARGRSHTTARQFDLSGALTVTLGLLAIVFAIVRTNVNGWASTQTIVLMSTGLALIAAFLLIEGRLTTWPLMPLRIFKSRSLGAANVTVFLLGSAVFAMWFFVSLYLQQVLGYSPLKAGLAFMPMTLTIVVASTVASRAAGRIGVKPLLAIGMLAQCVGLMLFAGISPHGTYAGDVLAASLVVAAGIGIAFVPATIAAVSGVATEEAGLASGLVNTSRLMGGAVGLALLAALATSRTTALLAGRTPTVPNLHAALTAGFHRGFVVAACFALIGALVALLGLQQVKSSKKADGATAGADTPVIE
jgi:EmrB/QacA subfamily drug resistance transporter